MSPDQGTVTVPVWVIASIIVPVAIGLLELLRRLGLRELSRRERRLSEVEEQLEDLESKMGSDHDGVADEMDVVKDEIRALRREIQR